MATTQELHTGNGSSTLFNFTFEYLKESDIKVSLDGVDQLTTAYSVENATNIRFVTAPGDGVAIRIYRQTAQDAPPATFFAGSSIRAQDLNANFLQQLYVAQETDNIARNLTAGDIAPGSITNNLLADDAVTESKIADSNVTTDKINTNAVTTAKLANSSVTSAKIVDGTIVNDDISASAEIAVSKLADGTARQLLQTDAGGTGVEWTSNVSIPGTLDVTGASTFTGTSTFNARSTSTERTITASAFDLSTGNYWTVGAVAIPNPTNAVAGTAGLIRVTVAPTSWASNFKWPNGSYLAPTSFPAIVPFYVKDSTTILMGPFTQGIA